MPQKEKETTTNNIKADPELGDIEDLFKEIAKSCELKEYLKEWLEINED